MEKVDKELADFLADFEEVQDVSRVRENRDALFPILTMNEKERLLLVHRLKSAKVHRRPMLLFPISCASCSSSIAVRRMKS